MTWSEVSDFFHMGGYAFYVWGSVCVVALCLIVEPLLVRARWRKAVSSAAQTRQRDGQ